MDFGRPFLRRNPLRDYMLPDDIEDPLFMSNINIPPSKLFSIPKFPDSPLYPEYSIPNSFHTKLEDFRSRVYNGQFSADGDIYYVSSQDEIKMYNVSDIYNWDCVCSFPARGVRWNITDLDLSLDHRQMIYCSVGPVVSLIRLATDNQESDYQSLILNSDDLEYGIFSCKFSAPGNEILVGTRMRSIEIHDLERKTLNYNIIEAHDDDINSACFGSQDSQVIYSGSDDCLIKIWDRRVNSDNPQGVLIGHREGITNVNSKGDGIKLVSNSKDQSIKLWDIRKLNSQDFCRQYLRTHRFSTGLDYRFGGYILEGYTKKLSADTSLLTFRGHKILGTLIRCYFSPLHTTNQRFVYTGSADGKVHIYDTYSGMSVWTLSEQDDGNETEDSICRDVSWHPYLSFIASTSFSGSINHYSYQ